LSEPILIMKIIDESLLRQFTREDDETFKNILAVWHYRGDGTQSGDDRLRKAMGDDVFEHYHYDTIATNCSVLLMFPRYRHPSGVEPGFGKARFPAEWFWSFSQIEENEDVEIKPSLIKRVPEASLALLKSLPDLEWMKVLRVNFWQHARGKAKRKHRPAPKGVIFFRFRDGLGLVASK
jgi:hypothetical protein